MDGVRNGWMRVKGSERLDTNEQERTCNDKWPKCWVRMTGGVNSLDILLGKDIIVQGHKSVVAHQRHCFCTVNGALEDQRDFCHVVSSRHQSFCRATSNRLTEKVWACIITTTVSCIVTFCMVAYWPLS